MRLRQCIRKHTGRRNRFAVAESLVLFSQGSRSGNPGLEGITASRLSARYQVDHSENLIHLDQDLPISGLLKSSQ
jgi:hypothetical protein